MGVEMVGLVEPAREKVVNSHSVGRQVSRLSLDWVTLGLDCCFCNLP